MSEIKFLKKGIRIDGQYFPVWYSVGQDGPCYPAGTITVYAKTYEHFPKDAFRSAAVENDTEIISDYIEKDLVRITPTNPLYPWVKAVVGTL